MIKSTRIRSAVWRHFHKTAINIVTCNYCEANLKYHGNTSNMREHLKRKHPDRPEKPDDTKDKQSNNNVDNVKKEIDNDNNVNTNEDEFVDYNYVTEEFEQTGSNIFAEDSPSTSTSTWNDDDDDEPKQKRQHLQQSIELTEEEKEKLDFNLVRMLVTDYQPLSFVENIGFKNLINTLQPLYHVPASSELSTEILPKIYKTIENVVKEKLEQVENVSLTTDLWSRDCNKTYITITAHFILEDALNSYVLETRRLEYNYTSQDVASEIATVITKWNLQEKVFAIVTEDNPNTKTMIQDNLQKNHQSCIALMLNSVIDGCFFGNNSELIRIVDKCRTIVEYFKNGVAATEKLRDVQNRMKLPELKIKGDDGNAKLWTSMLAMLERFCEIRIPLTATCCALRLPVELLENHEWSILREYVNLLRPFNHVAEELSSRKYFLISKIVPMLKCLRAILITDFRPQNEIIIGLHNALIETTGRFLDSLERNEFVAKATFLDPRFKKRAFANPQNADNVERILKDELKVQIQNDSDRDVDHHQHESDPNSIWFWHDESVRNRQKPAPEVRAKNIIEHYLFLPTPDVKRDPFQVWKDYRLGFPELYKLFLKYNCVPGNCVPAERIFTKKGMAINEKRNRLSAKNLNYFVFLNANL